MFTTTMVEQDVHHPARPGFHRLGGLDSPPWIEIDYRGPILLECIKHLRDKPDSLNEDLMLRLSDG